MDIKYNWQHPNWPKFTYQSGGLDKIINEFRVAFRLICTVFSSCFFRNFFNFLLIIRLHSVASFIVNIAYSYGCNAGSLLCLSL